ncbi:MAG: hypothetical protein V4649_06030 [Bacteroidota bacterium]
MKKHLIPFVFAISPFAFSGCCKSNASSTLPRQYVMSAKLTSSSQSSFEAVGPAYVTAVRLSDSLCTITGSDTMGDNIASRFTFKLRYFYGVGTYRVDSASESRGWFESTSPAVAQTAFASASVTVSAIKGSTITGTFSGTLTDGATVSEGRFTAYGTGF